MGQTLTPEQHDLLSRMAALCGGDLVEQTRKLASVGCDEARSLLAEWEFWERYERRLEAGRAEAAARVGLMIFEASNRISNRTLAEVA